MTTLLDESPIPRLPDYSDTMPTDCREFFAREMFLPTGRLISDEGLRLARFAYERVWEQNPLSDHDRENKACQITGHRSVRADAWSHEADLLNLMASPHVLAAAEAALGSRDIVWVGGYLHRHRLQHEWTYDELGWNGWHKDCGAKVAAAPIEHVNVWIYLDDLTAEDGVTQVMPGSVPRLRRMLTDGDDAEAYIRVAQAEWTAPDWGVHCTGVAGGGFLWTGPLFHRITPNRSGRGRRLITFEYELRSRTGYVVKSPMGNLTLDQVRKLAEAVPSDRRYLFGF